MSGKPSFFSKSEKTEDFLLGCVEIDGSRTGGLYIVMPHHRSKKQLSQFHSAAQQTDKPIQIFKFSGFAFANKQVQLMSKPNSATTKNQWIDK